MSLAIPPFFLAFVSEPTIGIPILVSAWVAVAWILWGPSPERRPPLLRRNWFPSDADLTSYVYFALADGRYSTVLEAATARLNETVHKRLGWTLAQLPLTEWGAERMGVPQARELRRVGRSLQEARAAAVVREGRFFIRWRFWLSPEADRRRFLSHVGRSLAESARWIRDLEAAA